MSKSSFEEQLVQSVYVLGRQRDQLESGKRKAARQLRYSKHSAQLVSIARQYDFGLIFFGAIGAVSLVLFDAKSDSNSWVIPLLGLVMMVLACGFAFKRRRIANRIKSFKDRFGSWQL